MPTTNSAHTTITYAYLDGHAAESAEWIGAREDAISAASEQLGADLVDGGDYAYTASAQEGGGTYRVTADELAEYGAAILSGRGAEAYSLWCAATGTEVRR